MKNSIYVVGLVLLLTLLVGTPNLRGQEVDHSYKPLTVKLDDSGQKYIRFITWHQIWATTQNLSDENADFKISPSIRRSRLLAYAQVSPRFLILTHFGLNGLRTDNLSNLGNNEDAPQLFLHGAWTEFKVTDGMYIGGGLHYWKGLSRLSNASTLNFMTLDQSRPFVHWHSLGITDQFARHLGIYAKGNFGKFDYRIAVNGPGEKPLGDGKDYGEMNSMLEYTGVTNPTRSGSETGNAIYEGYFRYNIFDTESTKLPYQVGTYLGKKKILGFGAGFFAHPDGMYSDTTGEHSNVTHLGADVFLDLPTASGDCLNAYVSYLNFNYGENYVSRWAGTGSVIYGHLGYYIQAANIMPYVAYQTANYEGFSDNPSALDVGVNYYILGHNAKLTLEYHSIMNDPRETTSQIRFQAHVFL